MKLKKDIKAIVLVGPTTVGKTSIAFELAKRYGGEIINGSAAPQFKGFPLLTFSADVIYQNEIPYHLFEIKEPNSCALSPDDYVSSVEQIVEQVISRGKTPIIDMSNLDYFRALERQSIYSSSGKYEFIGIEPGIGMDLAERIEDRVNSAINMGLLDELKKWNASGNKNDNIVPPSLSSLFNEYDSDKIRLEDAVRGVVDYLYQGAIRALQKYQTYPTIKWVCHNPQDMEKTIVQICKFINY